MVKQQNTSITRDIDKTKAAFPEHASTRQSAQSRIFTADDIIVSLSNAYENKRARQVTEWERTQAARLQRAA